MEKNNENKIGTIGSKSIGNDLESIVFSGSLEMLSPPVLFASPNNSTKKENSEKEQSENEEAKEVNQLKTDTGEPKGFRATHLSNHDISTSLQPPLQFKSKTKPEEDEEEVQEKDTTPLIFATTPIDPGDDSNDDASGAANNDGSGDDPPVQRKEGNSDVISSSNNDIPEEVMGKMESTIGHSFSNVNIHTDSSKAKDVGALAYTQGTDIHFAPGQFNPNSSSGQELLGHELTHVKQQAEGRVTPTTQASNGMAVNDDKGLEKEADNMGAKAANHPVQKKNDAAISSSGVSGENSQLKSNTIQKSEDDENQEEEVRTIPDTAIVRRGSTNISESNQTYDITGSYREISSQLELEESADGQAGDASITSVPEYYYDPINERSARVIINIQIVKRMPNWTNLDHYREQAEHHEDEEYRRYYRQAVAAWERFYADLEEHENAHNAIDRQHFENMHTQLIGKNLTESDEQITNIVQAADAANNHYHDTDGATETLDFVQEPYEGRIRNNNSTAQHKKAGPENGNQTITHQNNSDRSIRTDQPIQKKDVLQYKKPKKENSKLPDKAPDVKSLLSASFKNLKLSAGHIEKLQKCLDARLEIEKLEEKVDKIGNSILSTDVRKREQLFKQINKLTPQNIKSIIVPTELVLSDDFRGDKAELKDIKAFKEALYLKYISEPTFFVLGEGFEPSPIFTSVEWSKNRWKMGHDSGRITFDHGIRPQKFNLAYQSVLLKGSIDALERMLAIRKEMGGIDPLAEGKKVGETYGHVWNTTVKVRNKVGNPKGYCPDQEGKLELNKDYENTQGAKCVIVGEDNWSHIYSLDSFTVKDLKGVIGDEYGYLLTDGAEVSVQRVRTKDGFELGFGAGKTGTGWRYEQILSELEQFSIGAIIGDFSEDPTATETVGQIVMGAVPIAGQIADARDTAAAIQKVWNSGGKDGKLQLTFAIVGWIPLLGDGIKAAWKGGGKKAATKFLVESVVKNADNLTKRLGKEIIDDPAGWAKRFGVDEAASHKMGKAIDEALESGSKKAINKIGKELIETYTKHGQNPFALINKAGGRWKNAIKILEQAEGGLKVAQELEVYRVAQFNEMVNYVGKTSQKYGPDVSLLGKPRFERTGTPSFKSDFDGSFIGPNASFFKERADDYMSKRFGGNWREIFDADIFTDPSRLHLYADATKKLSGGAAAAVEKRVVKDAELNVLAKMLNSGVPPEVVKKKAAELGVDFAQLTARQNELQDLSASYLAGLLKKGHSEDAVKKQAAEMGVDFKKVLEKHKTNADAFRDLELKLDSLHNKFLSEKNPATRAAIAEEMAKIQGKINASIPGPYMTPGGVLKHTTQRDKALRTILQGAEFTPSMAYMQVMDDYFMLVTALPANNIFTEKSAKSFAKYADRLMITAGRFGAVDAGTATVRTQFDEIFGILQRARKEGPKSDLSNIQGILQSNSSKLQQQINNIETALKKTSDKYISELADKSKLTSEKGFIAKTLGYLQKSKGSIAGMANLQLAKNYADKKQSQKDIDDANDKVGQKKSVKNKQSVITKPFVLNQNTVQLKSTSNIIQKSANDTYKDIILHFYLGETKTGFGDLTERDMNQTGRTEGGTKKPEDNSTPHDQTKHHYIPVAGFDEIADMGMVLESYDPNFTISQIILSTGHGLINDKGTATWKVGTESLTAKNLAEKPIVFKASHWASGGSIHNWSCSQGADKEMSYQIQRILSENKAAYYANTEENMLMPGTNQTNNPLEENHKQLEGVDPVQQKSKQFSLDLYNSSEQVTQAKVPDGINIHENSSKSTDLGALAFTQGRDIHFAPGQFKPDTHAGKQLIGHELAHVHQQKEGRVQPTTEENGNKINDDPKLEKEADDFGVKYASGNASIGNSTESFSGSSIQKADDFSYFDYLSPPKNSSDLVKKLKHYLDTNLSVDLINAFAGGYNHHMYGAPVSSDSSDNSIVNVLSYAPYPMIQGAKALYPGLQEKIMNKMGGFSNNVTAQLILAIYYLNSPEKNGLHKDVALCLLTNESRPKELIRLLERKNIKLKNRKRIIQDYQNTFFGNISKNGLIEDIKSSLSKDNEKRVLALLDHELTNADELVYHITGDTDSKKAASVFTNALAQNGFKGIDDLNNNWERYIRKPLPNVGYIFHKSSLFDAVKKELGADSQAWKIIEPIKRGYYSWKFQEGVGGMAEYLGLDKEKVNNAKKSEEDLILESAIQIVEEASLAGAMELDLNDKDSITNSLSLGYNRNNFVSKKENYKPQLQWAINTIRTLFPKKIQKAESIEKGALLIQWTLLKTKIDRLIDLSFSDKEKKLAFKLELNRQGSESKEHMISDEFYVKIMNGDKNGALEIAESMWSKGLSSSLLSNLQNTESKDTLGKILRPRLENPKSVIKKKLGKHYSRRILALLGGENNNTKILQGYYLLRYEVLERKPDLDYLMKFFTLEGMTPDVKESIVHTFIAKEAGLLAFLGDHGINIDKKQALLNLIETRRFTKKEFRFGDEGYKEYDKKTKRNYKFLKLRDIINPAKTVDEQIDRAEEYGKERGMDDSRLTGILARESLNRLKSLLRSEEELQVLMGQMGTNDINEIANLEYDEFKTRVDTLRREIEADAALFSLIVEILVSTVILLATGGTAGILLAGLASKAAGMLTNEAILGDKYDLFSSQNFKSLATGVITDLATAGMSKRFEIFKKTQQFQNMTSTKVAMTYVKQSLKESVVTNAIEITINEKPPNLQDFIIDITSASAFAGVRGKFDGIYAKELSKNKEDAVDLIHDFGEAISTQVVKTTVSGDDFDGLTFAQSAARIASMKARSRIHNTADDKNSTKEGEENSNQKLLETSLDGYSETKTDKDSSSSENKDIGTLEDGQKDKDYNITKEKLAISGPVKENTPGTTSSKYEDHSDARKILDQKGIDWDTAIRSVEEGGEVYKKLLEIRDELHESVKKQGGYLDENATTLPTSDLDYQFERGSDLIKVDEYLTKKFGADYKTVFKIDLFITGKRLKITETIKDKQARKRIEVSHIKEAELYDLAKMVRYTAPDNPLFEKIQQKLNALSPKERKRINDINSLSPADKKEHFKTLLLTSDAKMDELKTLEGQTNKDTDKINNLKKEIALIQIQINGLADDAYTAKAAMGGENIDAKLDLRSQLSSQLAMIQKIIKSKQGLGKAAREYELYKYIHRTFEAIIKSGEKLSSKQENLHNISTEVYGLKEDAFREFYSLFMSKRSDEQFESVIGPILHELHNLHEKLKIETDIHEKPEDGQKHKSDNKNDENQIEKKSVETAKIKSQEADSKSHKPPLIRKILAKLGGRLAKAHYSRNDKNVMPETEPRNDDNWILLSETKSLYHQHGEKGRKNKKYISKDGHLEAVYDENGFLVKDEENIGTFNFYGPNVSVLKHIIFDVIPYHMWGNSLHDKTPLINRLLGPRIKERAKNFINNKLSSLKGKIFGKDAEASKQVNENSEADDRGKPGDATSLIRKILIKIGGNYAKNHYNRNKNNNMPEVEPVNDDNWIRLSELESLYHQQGEHARNNRKYISKDGYHEAVYDENGKLVTDDENVGTYNFYGPNVSKIGHFFKDVLPYWIYGNTPQDKTKLRNRLIGPRISERFTNKTKSIYDEINQFIPGFKGKIYNERKEEEEENKPIQKKSISESNTTLHDHAANSSIKDIKIDKNINIKENSSEATKHEALAFTQGNNIHFAPGQFNPNTAQGKQLIGHEMAHVVQQKQGRVQPTTLSNGLPVNNDPSLEKEADDFGVKFASSIQNGNHNNPTGPSKEAFTLNSSDTHQFKLNDFPQAFNFQSYSGFTPSSNHIIQKKGPEDEEEQVDQIEEEIKAVTNPEKNGLENKDEGEPLTLEQEMENFKIKTVGHTQEGLDTYQGTMLRSMLKNSGEKKYKNNPEKWFQEFVSFNLFGRNCKGVRPEFAVLLKKAEAITIDELQKESGENLNAKEAGEKLGINQGYKTSRVFKQENLAYQSMHLFGLAIDINFDNNPWFWGAEEYDGAKIKPTLKRMQALVKTKLTIDLDKIDKNDKKGGIGFGADTNVIGDKKKLDNGEKVGKIYDNFAQVDKIYQEYFALLDNRELLEKLLKSTESEHWKGKSADEAITIIKGDLFDMSYIASRNPGVKPKNYSKKRDSFIEEEIEQDGKPANLKKEGIMDLDKRLVVSMAKAGLDWGGKYGDMMHFDMRFTGLGEKIHKSKKKEEVKNHAVGLKHYNNLSKIDELVTSLKKAIKNFKNKSNNKNLSTLKNKIKTADIILDYEFAKDFSQEKVDSFKSKRTPLTELVKEAKDLVVLHETKE